MTATPEKTEEKAARARNVFPDLSTETKESEARALVFADGSLASSILTSLRSHGIGKGEAREKVIAEIKKGFGTGKDKVSESTIKTQVYRGTLYLRLIGEVEAPPKAEVKPTGNKSSKKSGSKKNGGSKKESADKTGSDQEHPTSEGSAPLDTNGGASGQ